MERPKRARIRSPRPVVLYDVLFIEPIGRAEVVIVRIFGRERTIIYVF